MDYLEKTGAKVRQVRAFEDNPKHKHLAKCRYDCEIEGGRLVQKIADL